MLLLNLFKLICCCVCVCAHTFASAVAAFVAARERERSRTFAFCAQEIALNPEQVQCPRNDESVLHLLLFGVRLIDRLEAFSLFRAAPFHLLCCNPRRGKASWQQRVGGYFESRGLD
jgi:hypothetical protein